MNVRARKHSYNRVAHLVWQALHPLGKGIEYKDACKQRLVKASEAEKVASLLVRRIGKAAGIGKLQDEHKQATELQKKAVSLKGLLKAILGSPTSGQFKEALAAARDADIPLNCPCLAFEWWALVEAPCSFIFSGWAWPTL